MKNEILESPGFRKASGDREQTSINEDKLMYFFRNGEELVCCGGLEIFEDCTFPCNIQEIKEEQALQFTFPVSLSTNTMKKNSGSFLSNAELWNIHRRRKTRPERRYI